MPKGYPKHKFPNGVIPLKANKDKHASASIKPRAVPNPKLSGKFWMITGPQNTPKVRQSTEDVALAEAERLANLHPGTEFYVLEATTVVVSKSTVVQKL